MGIHPDLCVLVYVDGMGYYLHKLFAQRYGIREGVEIHPSVALRHEKEIPLSERARMKSWIHPDDRKYMEERGMVVHQKVEYIPPSSAAEEVQNMWDRLYQELI